MKKYPKTNWGCCEGHQDELLDQGYKVPHTDLSDRQIILQAIDRHARLALDDRRDARKQEHGYSKGFDNGSALTHELSAASLAVAIGIASDTWQSAERLKHFREWGGRPRRSGHQNRNGNEAGPSLSSLASVESAAAA